MTARTAIKVSMGKRPHYFHGQLLLEDDFSDEQKFHVQARTRHNLILHGWGVVRGLTITRAGDKSVHISPGEAVDEEGREVFLDKPQVIELSAFGPNDHVNVGLKYEEEPDAKGTARNRRVDCYAAVTLSNGSEPGSELILATVALDDQGKVQDSAIDYSRTKYVGLAHGSITAIHLNDSLRKGWLRLPFRPSPLVDIPDGEKEVPPPFRVRSSTTLSPDHHDPSMKDRGAGGTMAIPIPPSVTQVTRLRVAGSTNEGEIHVILYVGGWDMQKNEHRREQILSEKITSDKRSGDTRFVETFEIKQTKLDPESATLGIWLRGTRKTSISLIAVEFAY